MDEQVEAFPLERQWLKLRPSEYFRRQCYISFDADEWNLAASAERIGPDRILWASDYPHPEYRSQVVKELRERVSPLSDENQRKVVGGNAIAAYRLPL
jgi:predicted TIM-barrel fold metal-dependent hydrolase